MVEQWWDFTEYFTEYFSGKYTNCKIHRKLHPGPEWCILHIIHSKDIDDVISLVFTIVCANNQFVHIIQRKLHGGLKIWISLLSVKNNTFFFHSLRSFVKYCFYCSKIIFISSRHHATSFGGERDLGTRLYVTRIRPACGLWLNVPAYCFLLFFGLRWLQVRF